MMEPDRRTSIRRPVTQQVMLSHEKGFRLCNIQNISLKGALLDIGWGVLTRDVPVELSIDLPWRDERKTLRLPAQVARVSPSGTAIKFRDLDVDVYGALAHFLRRHNR